MEIQPMNPLKIALIGYGKMGKAIERVAPNMNTEIVYIGSKNWALNPNDILNSGAQVAIEFTQPLSAPENVGQLLKLGIPTVCGTTGWSHLEPDLRLQCANSNGSVMVGSNFSLGVHLFFALNKKLAQWMAGFPEYQASIHEVHHLEKKDAPSGTAITTANLIINNNPRYTQFTLHPNDANASQLQIKAERLADVKGIHQVQWDGPMDRIELSHSAKSRDGFAIGALHAAHWILNKKGWFQVEEMFDFQ